MRNTNITFLILEKLNQKVAADELEKTIKTGISYFNREDLHEYVQEYAKKLAVLFHQENNRSKSKRLFFILAIKQKNKTLKRRL